MDQSYIQTCVEIAVHSRWIASYFYGNLPVELLDQCPCKWCRERKSGKKKDT